MKLDEKGSLDDEYPLLKHFGDRYCPLTDEEARVADFDRRIESVGKLLVRESLRLWNRLSPEGRASYSPEDIFLEIWVELKLKNDAFDPSRGGYRTFCRSLVHNKFLSLASTARVVKLPSDSASIFKRGIPDEVEWLAAASRDHGVLNLASVPGLAPCAEEEAILAEQEAISTEEASRRLDSLTFMESLAVSAMAVWGGPRRLLRDIAAEHHVRIGVLRRAFASAKVKLGKIEDRS